MTCYLRNGTKARRAVPCDHDAIIQGKNTACCDPDDQCLTNGLCRDPGVSNITNFVWFFGSTDLTFQDPSSGNYCDKVNNRNNHLIFKCPEPEKWCCDTGEPAPPEDRVNRTNTTCCNISDLVFTAPEPAVYTTAAYSGLAFTVKTLTTVSLPTVSFISNATGTPAPSASGTGLAAAPSSSTPSLAIGLGTGLGGGAVIALGLGWFFLRRRRKTMSESPEIEVATEEPPEMTGQDIAETSGKERFEIQGKDPPVEVIGDVYRAELPATTDRAEVRG
ncbi:hypothetical protein BKA63DRAFT_602435 [Paraphoma chrysanthemicola]|nr:hypothetical protein BKA63DRAFT_602435 [Paraphoma chrysanthemicola]